MLNKPAVTAVPIHDLLARRWSPRAFDPDQPVRREQLQSLFEAARWAPSCFGDEPWRFIVWNRHEDPAAWQQAFDCLAEGNQAWVKDVPVLVAVLADPHFRHNGRPNRWAQYDTGAAAVSLCLQAVALGLAAHQMGGFDAERLKATFGLPDAIVPMAMIAIGNQAEPERLGEELRAKEIAARSRRSLNEIVSARAWGSPFQAG